MQTKSTFHDKWCSPRQSILSKAGEESVKSAGFDLLASIATITLDARTAYLDQHNIIWYLKTTKYLQK